MINEQNKSFYSAIPSGNSISEAPGSLHTVGEQQAGILTRKIFNRLTTEFLFWKRTNELIVNINR